MDAAQGFRYGSRKIEFVLPAELLEKVEGDDIIFSVLTDRIGTHGGVIRYKDGGDHHYISQQDG